MTPSEETSAKSSNDDRTHLDDERHNKQARDRNATLFNAFNIKNNNDNKKMTIQRERGPEYFSNQLVGVQQQQYQHQNTPHKGNLTPHNMFNSDSQIIGRRQDSGYWSRNASGSFSAQTGNGRSNTNL